MYTLSGWTSISPVVTSYFSKIKRKRTYFSPRGVLILREDKIVNPKNITGSNIRRMRIEKGIRQTELVKQLQFNNVEITRETLVKIEGGKQHIKLKQLTKIRQILSTSFEKILIN